MKKKTYILIISKVFPQTHKRQGEPTNFVDSIAYLNKIHTIRSNFELWEKRIAEINAGRARLSVRVWEDQPYRSKQREVFAFESVGLEKLKRIDFEKMFAGYVEGESIDREINIKDLAKNDGLSTADFEYWFQGYDTSKPMAIIHFSNYRSS